MTIGRPFPKGVSGNPGGRPKKDWTWSGLLEQVANEIEPKSGKPFKELVTRRLWVEAVNGNLGAQKEIMNRMEGMPTQNTDLTSGGKPIPILSSKDVSENNSDEETGEVD